MLIWLFFQGVPVFLEEGDYQEIQTFNILEYPKSIKLVKEDMGTPELFLASSTNYEGTFDCILKFSSVHAFSQVFCYFFLSALISNILEHFCWKKRIRLGVNFMFFFRSISFQIPTCLKLLGCEQIWMCNWSNTFLWGQAGFLRHKPKMTLCGADITCKVENLPLKSTWMKDRARVGTKLLM